MKSSAAAAREAAASASDTNIQLSNRGVVDWSSRSLVIDGERNDFYGVPQFEETAVCKRDYIRTRLGVYCVILHKITV